MFCMNRPIIPNKPSQDSYHIYLQITWPHILHIYIYFEPGLLLKKQFLLRNYSKCPITFSFCSTISVNISYVSFMLHFIQLPFSFMLTQILLNQEVRSGTGSFGSLIRDQQDIVVSGERTTLAASHPRGMVAIQRLGYL